MIKVLKKFQVQMSPFQATKDWALNNTDNENLLLFESTGSDDGEAVALEYIDYDSGIGLPFTNSYCDVALELQAADRAIFREGEKITGPFYPDTDPTNIDGTYKRSIYYQVKSSFYNDYRDFTKLLGVEKLDFELSKTKRRLEDNIKMFDIPRLVFGDKMVPNTVEMPNTSLDNDFLISDDGNGNLLAGTNLFSKQQEIGQFQNIFVTGSNSDCSYYFILNPPPSPIGLSASVHRPNAQQAVLTWQTSSNAIVEDGFIIERSDNIIPFVIIGIVGTGVLTYNDNTLQPNHFYTYRVYAYTVFERSGYSNTASLWGPAPPIFTVQPQDAYVDIGAQGSFNATTLAYYPEVTYSWQICESQDYWNTNMDNWDANVRLGPVYWDDIGSSTCNVWVDLIDDSRITGSYGISYITGSDSTQLIINNVTLEDSHSYRATATNWVGTAISDEADLIVSTIVHPPLIVSNPVDQITYLSQTASFSVVASGTPPLIYQWMSESINVVDDTRITGSNNSTIIINNIQWTDSGSYKVSVTNASGSVTSNSASLTVLDNAILTYASDSFSSSVGITQGSHVEQPNIEVGPSMTSGILSGDYILSVVTTETAQSASADIGFYSGAVTTVIVATGSPPQSASADIGFYAGAVTTVIIATGSLPQSASADIGFYSGVISVVVTEVTKTEEIYSITAGLYSGSYE